MNKEILGLRSSKCLRTRLSKEQVNYKTVRKEISAKRRNYEVFLLSSMTTGVSGNIWKNGSNDQKKQRISDGYTVPIFSPLYYNNQCDDGIFFMATLLEYWISVTVHDE